MFKSKKGRSEQRGVVGVVELPGRANQVENELEAILEAQDDVAIMFYKKAHEVARFGQPKEEPPIQTVGSLRLFEFEINRLAVYYTVEETSPRRVTIVGFFNFADIAQNDARAEALRRLR